MQAPFVASSMPSSCLVFAPETLDLREPLPCPVQSDASSALSSLASKRQPCASTCPDLSLLIHTRVGRTRHSPSAMTEHVAGRRAGCWNFIYGRGHVLGFLEGAGANESVSWAHASVIGTSSYTVLSGDLPSLYRTVQYSTGMYIYTYIRVHHMKSIPYSRQFVILPPPKLIALFFP